MSLGRDTPRLVVVVFDGLRPDLVTRRRCRIWTAFAPWRSCVTAMPSSAVDALDAQTLVLVLSDHGQITVTREIPLFEDLTRAGFPTAAAAADDAMLLGVAGRGRRGAPAAWRPRGWKPRRSHRQPG